MDNEPNYETDDVKNIETSEDHLKSEPNDSCSISSKSEKESDTIPEKRDTVIHDEQNDPEEEEVVVSFHFRPETDIPIICLILAVMFVIADSVFGFFNMFQ